MAFISTPDDPPPESAGHLAYVLWIAQDCHGIEWATPESAIDHDLDILGDDLVDFIEKLEARYGEWVWEWPWQRFAELNEGLSLLFPLMALWQLVSWPFRGRFTYPSRFERLELQHIAKVLEAGQWIEP